jgi:hypothetical protein
MMRIEHLVLKVLNSNQSSHRQSRQLAFALNIAIEALKKYQAEREKYEKESGLATKSAAREAFAAIEKMMEDDENPEQIVKVDPYLESLRNIEYILEKMWNRYIDS